MYICLFNKMLVYQYVIEEDVCRVFEEEDGEGIAESNIIKTFFGGHPRSNKRSFVVNNSE